ncbi:quinone-dependent dihydroorotate dehydrogenase [Arcicella sp. LKC2W]|uniref:quinone-dependent dihydroorotate dehydrogenase n=1 Tax=Arcicella sp. LKC2W TaxID=2984198 RepID=UPI002B1FC535|nr:quinone-dependent dihydroorotate dehydrogenase [Arcicella sp. LKC2W]MEA5459897.1 quinone-dependent dihydroorotate dehydrogenase [Arcicella sp. LKC2W]
MYKYILQPLLFKLDAEKAHYVTFDLIKFLFKIPFVPQIFRAIYHYEHPSLEREVFGLKFKNPVGLAAGFDKNALMIDEFSNLGFGFIEIGTLTPKGQPGNDKPRLFRLKPDQAIINRMGFNNDGVKVAVEKLKARNSNILVGGNIGKNKVTPNENAVDDYLICFHELFDYVDYFVVNVSSPNTPNLRALQEKEPLKNLLQTLQNENIKKVKQKPILLKIAPDLTESQLDDIVEIVQETKIAGVIATNTTISREGLKSDQNLVQEMGGLSGKPVTKRSTEVIKYLSEKSNKSFPIIGVGGIHTAEDAIEKLKAGASLVQIYTGFIYAGPSLASDINKALVRG